MQDNILIFKTNIRTQFDKEKIADVLNTLESVDEWSLDMQDVDCVLRVVSSTNITMELISKVIKTGYECSELD